MSEYENLPEGEAEGRLVYVLSLGLHQDEYKGEKKKPAEKKVLGIEIIDSDVEINGEKKPRLLWTRPFNSFPSLTERGKESEHYWVFDPTVQEGDKPDWEKQLGKPCNVVVVHAQSKDGSRTYDNISKLTRIPEKYQDKVGENRLDTGIALTTESDLHKMLFGLARYVYDQRIEEEDAEKPTEESQDYDDDIPF